MDIPNKCKLEKVAAKLDSKFSLSNIRVCKDGVEACDGRALVRLDGETGSEGFLATKVLKKLRGKPSGSLRVDGGMIRDDETLCGASLAPTTEGSWPDTSGVWLREKAATVRLNLGYLKNVLEALGADEDTLADVHIGTPEQPINIEVVVGGTGRAALMPCVE
jgi:hypothetical protein